MQANDVRILKSAALPTLMLGAIAVVTAFLIAGGKGALGALIGTLLVCAFFSISVLAVSFAARISPHFMAAAALASYIVKVVVIMIALSVFGDTTAWEPRAFAWTVVLCTIGWTVAEVRAFMKTKILYVDPDVQLPWQRDT
ncbi:hypothetical protein ITP53_35995 [Nonomuraea sp. K274]|uniref:ATP synthase protein I n=1 Tax=Nonomuraea cypriaca TaxID=1187855 RepID=A0A931AIY8_9ACTN|nr:hypothetical protein [Nonomuraea cypriaca]MBF8191020.1 hypothetical protein [Nonomuraea cypriaca]